MHQGTIVMKVKEKLYEGRGRPRKFQPGEIVEWRLRAPDSLLMELRVLARIGKRSINDEIIARLLLSLNYQPDKPVIRTARAEKLISLATRFEMWISTLKPHADNQSAVKDADLNDDEYLWVWINGEKEVIKGKASGYSMRIPENLSDEIRVMARLHKRSLNEEMLTRILVSMGYYSAGILEQNDDAQALKVLCLEFERYLKERIEEAEKRALPWEDSPPEM